MNAPKTLGKNERLKSRKQIERLFKQGKSFMYFPFRVYYVFETTQPVPTNTASRPLLFGVGVSAKNFRKAVDRNRIKRLTREAYRLQKQALQDKLQIQQRTLHLFFIYTGKDLPEYEIVNEKTGGILKKLMEITNK